MLDAVTKRRIDDARDISVSYTHLRSPRDS